MARVQVRLTNVHTCNTLEERRKVADYIAVICNGAVSDQVPYQTVATDEYEFVLDQGNDWWLYFDRSNPHVFWIKNRYEDLAAAEALMRWVAYRFGAEVLTHIG